ncbi:hypothetical protein [Sphingomonas solaris]|uniref:Lipoprotein n=1 Tax=Alterirhizorhabdus solaris TaxID=2529389 RepID=A0A558QZG3_9SPHN|nr:hypothetical protein [Sphingomonas solaris]TVV72520.1 hypothetical protein FOY91_14380 [Sphingomonas solaris]
MRTIGTCLMAPLVLAGCGSSGDGAAGGSKVTGATPPAGPAIVTPAGSSSTVAIPEAPIDKPTVAAPFTDAWLGKWVGVEGLALTIARGDRPDTYRLHVALMDGVNDYIGTAAGETIRFERDGQTATIRATTGAETGLKWLADKKNCLTIREGEGFCRD